MTNVSKAMEYATTFEREAMREKLDSDFKEENTRLRSMNLRLIEALASQAPLVNTHYEGCYDSGPRHYECALLEVKKLRRAWVGLTDEEMKQCSYDAEGFTIGRKVAMRAVEAKLKEKNG